MKLNFRINDDSEQEHNEIEVLCSLDELGIITDMLTDLYDGIKDYVLSNERINASFLGHVHYRDRCNNWDSEDGDIVFYVKNEDEKHHR